MGKSTKPEHYNSVVEAFKLYRSSKNAISYYSHDIISSENKDLADPLIEKAKSIVRMVDNAIIKINFCCNNGDKISAILFYRYMSDNIYKEDEIIRKLMIKGTPVSKPTYHRLKEQGICAACHYIWNDEVDSGIIKNVDLNSLIPNN